MNISEQFQNIPELALILKGKVSEQFQSFPERFVTTPNNISEFRLEFSSLLSIYKFIPLISQGISRDSLEIFPQGNPRGCPRESLGLPRGINLRQIHLSAVNNFDIKSWLKQ